MIVLVKRLYQFDFISIWSVFLSAVFNIYPGAHRAEKPNGILQIIFHVGIQNDCMRRNFRKKLENNTPIKYSIRMLDIVNKEKMTNEELLIVAI